jgi:hypothetical protein
MDAWVGISGAWRITVDLFNVTNRAWNDITYYYAYRHPGESFASVGPVVHPGMPRTLHVTASIAY